MWCVLSFIMGPPAILAGKHPNWIKTPSAFKPTAHLKLVKHCCCSSFFYLSSFSSSSFVWNPSTFALLNCFPFPSNDHLPSSAQTDIVAVRTPQEGPHSFLSTRGPSPIDTSDSDCTKLGETPSPRRNQQTDCSPSPRSRSPRPSSLPGVGDNSSVAATPKRSLPRGSEVGVTIDFFSFLTVIHPFIQLIQNANCPGSRNGSSPPISSWPACSQVFCWWLGWGAAFNCTYKVSNIFEAR